jgi:chitinase
VTLRWQSAVVGGGFAAYVIRRDGEIVGASFDDATYEDLDVHPGSTYTYTVEMVDELGNWSPPSPGLVVSVPGATDPLPPTAPSGLRATRTADGVRLSWSAGLDEQRPVSYCIYDGARLVGTTSATSFEVVAMTPGVAHIFSVRALDVDGTLSGPSNLAAG